MRITFGSNPAEYTSIQLEDPDIVKPGIYRNSVNFDRLLVVGTSTETRGLILVNSFLAYRITDLNRSFRWWLEPGASVTFTND